LTIHRAYAKIMFMPETPTNNQTDGEHPDQIPELQRGRRVYNDYSYNQLITGDLGAVLDFGIENDGKASPRNEVIIHTEDDRLLVSTDPHGRTFVFSEKAADSAVKHDLWDGFRPIELEHPEGEDYKRTIPPVVFGQAWDIAGLPASSAVKEVEIKGRSEDPTTYKSEILSEHNPFNILHEKYWRFDMASKIAAVPFKNPDLLDVPIDVNDRNRWMMEPPIAPYQEP
jgi:hypothetical protein